MTENALRDGVKKAKAKAGSAVVMDVNTGEILSIASYPAYDLNHPPSGQPQTRRFRPLMDALELGSVVKPLFVAKAIDKKRLSARERLYCENGTMTLPGGKIRDTHPHKYLTPAEIIKVSSNICTYKIAQRLGRSVFYDALSSFGLIRSPGTGLPGEWGGRVGEPSSWSEMRFANMSFGQGIAISPLQLTRSIAILANDGTDPGIRILARADQRSAADLQLPPLKVLAPQTARLITKMMTTVVEEEDGTGQLAAIPGIPVAGKTGTAQKYDPKTKSYSERIAAFTGIVPANRPKLAITVVIDEPQVRPAYGGLLAGPVFSEIGQKSINYLNSQGLIQLDSETKNILKSPLAEKSDARGGNARH
jgi:cell division protein FtsI (penicillin-binding protein 3)